MEALLEMDVEDLRFADNRFDKVVAMDVVSVAPDPTRLVDELRGECKPAGDVVIANHFRSRQPIIRGFENLLSPLSERLGFRLDLTVTRLEVVETCRANLFGGGKAALPEQPEAGHGGLSTRVHRTYGFRRRAGKRAGR